MVTKTINQMTSKLRGSSFLVRLALCAGFWAAGTILFSQPALADNSALWGKNGEQWKPDSRLPDFSYAGYHSGETPIPTVGVKSNVKDFGAKGDGQTDDTDAFKKAIEATEGGAILIPAGKYVLTDILYIRKSNLVLRGEGPDKTVLYFPKPLQEIKPNMSATTTGQPTTNYSWSGGLIWVEGQQKGENLGSVKAKALRGSREIELDRPAKVKPGQKIEIYMEDPGDGSLLNYLYAGQSGDTSKIKKTRCYFVSRVSGVDGSKITLERPLRTDVDPLWNTRVSVFAPTATEVGVENLAFEFPNQPYRGHFLEDGYNPLAFSYGAADGWGRNLKVINADSGPFLGGSSFVTLDGLVFEAQRTPDKTGVAGHHGVTMGTDNLLQNFDFRCEFVHDISVEQSAGSVVSKGKGVDMCFDHHKRYPHANLFTELDLGAGTRMYKCGGGQNLGRHSAAWTTFWNIRADQPLHAPPADFGPDLMNFIALSSKDVPVLEPNGRWFEPVSPADIEPKNLYEAQLQKRLGPKSSANQ